MTHTIDSDTIDTPAGAYRIDYITDDSAERPDNDGFGMVIIGRHDRIDVTTGAGADRVADAIRSGMSGRAIVRYLTMIGYNGATLVSHDYWDADATSDRDDRVWGVAWAPDDVPVTRGGDYVGAVLSEWRAWADGDVFGVRVTSPAGNVVHEVWGYYGYDDCQLYARQDAECKINADADARVDSANLVGAGIVGIV